MRLPYVYKSAMFMARYDIAKSLKFTRIKENRRLGAGKDNYVCGFDVLVNKKTRYLNRLLGLRNINLFK